MTAFDLTIFLKMILNYDWCSHRCYDLRVKGQRLCVAIKEQTWSLNLNFLVQIPNYVTLVESLIYVCLKLGIIIYLLYTVVDK